MSVKQHPIELPEAAAMARVLSAEREARAALETAEREAAALREAARARAKLIAAAAARRAAAVRASMERRCADRLARLDADERQAHSQGAIDPASHSRLEAAIAHLAAELTTEPP